MGEYQKDYNNSSASAEGVKIVECEDIFEFSEGLAAIKQNGLWGYINVKGEIVIPYQYTFAMPFSEGLAMVTLDSQEGFIDKQGSQVIPFKHLFAEDFREGLAVVSDEEGEVYGYVDQAGKVVIPFQYEYADSFYEDLAVVSKEIDDELLTGFINQQGETVIDFKFLDANNFVDDYTSAEIEGYKVVINKLGEEVLRIPNSEGLRVRSYGEALLWLENGVWSYQNLNTGEKRVILDMEGISAIDDGLIVIRDKKGKFGVLDKKGQMPIPCIYDELGTPSEGFVAFRQNKKYGFLDYRGNVIIKPKYDETSVFSSGVAIVKKGKMKYVIDFKEQILFSLKNESFLKRILKSNSIVKKVLFRILILIAIFAVFYYLKK